MTKWRFWVPGQPPSINHMYEPVYIRRSDGRTVRKYKKAQGVEEYQVAAALICKGAKPMGWVPETRIRIVYAFVLTKDIDCDNAMKALNDALAKAIKPDDKLFDRHFLPYVESKAVGGKFEAGVDITIMNENVWLKELARE